MQAQKVVRALKTPATLLLLLAILGYGAYWGYQQVNLGVSRSDTPCVQQDVGKELTSDKITIRVFNGGERGGAARTTRTHFIAWGYTVIYYNNSDRDVDKVTVIGNSANDPEVRLVASNFKDAVTEGDGRVDHVVDVIMPTRYVTIKTPPTAIPVDGPVCLPVIEKSSAVPTVSGSASPAPTQSATKK